MNRWLKVRAGFVFCLFLTFYGGLVFRLIQLQIIPDETLKKLSEKKIVKDVKKVAYRLPILDRNNDLLAFTVPAGSIFARPKLIKNKKEAALSLKYHLGGNVSQWYSKLKTKKNFVWLQRQVDQQIAESLEKDKIAGLFVQHENLRVYPNDNFLSHVLGFTDIDGNGIEGIEYTLNKDLVATNERYSAVKDGKGSYAYLEQSYYEPKKIEGVELTIDKRFQLALEDILAEAQLEHRAKVIMGVIVNPRSGEILAMAQTPSFDPNEPAQYAQTNFTNHWIQSLYEPGSTMKVLFSAYAIEKGLVTPKTLFNCGNGQTLIGNKIIKEADAHHRFGMIPLEKVIEVSSNIGSIKLSQKLSDDDFTQLFQWFRLDSKTGIPLPGEVVGGLKETSKKSAFQMATVSFGQGFSVNPLQMVSAFQTIANEGKFVGLKLIKNQAQESKQVLNERTARQVKDMLVKVTEGKEGTGREARIDNIHIAGKTGTAQKYDPVLKAYSPQKYFASFIGFFPAEQPEYLVAVMVDEPNQRIYAAETAVPIFKRIALSLIDFSEKPAAHILSQKKAVPSDKSSSAHRPTRLATAK